MSLSLSYVYLPYQSDPMEKKKLGSTLRGFTTTWCSFSYVHKGGIKELGRPIVHLFLVCNSLCQNMENMTT